MSFILFPNNLSPQDINEDFIGFGYPLDIDAFILSPGVQEYINNRVTNPTVQQQLHQIIDAVRQEPNELTYLLKFLEFLDSLVNYSEEEDADNIEYMQEANRKMEMSNAKKREYLAYVDAFKWWQQVRQTLQGLDNDAKIEYLIANEQERLAKKLPQFEFSTQNEDGLIKDYLRNKRNELCLTSYDAEKPLDELYIINTTGKKYPFFDEASPFILKLFYDDVDMTMLPTLKKLQRKERDEEQEEKDIMEGAQQVWNKVKLAVFLKDKIGDRLICDPAALKMTDEFASVLRNLGVQNVQPYLFALKF